MKAVILCAGDNHSDWPSNSKPKCLHHVEGQVILEGIMDTLNEAGIRDDDIIIVVGYKLNDIMEWLIENKREGASVVINDMWASDSIQSVVVGLRHVDEHMSALVICGDILLDESHVSTIRDFYSIRADVGYLRSEKPWGIYRYPWYDSHNQIAIVKLSPDLISELCYTKLAYSLAEQWMFRMKRSWDPGLGVVFGALLNELVYVFNSEASPIVDFIRDVDRYSDTDESREVSS